MEWICDARFGEEWESGYKGLGLGDKVESWEIEDKGEYVFGNEMGIDDGFIFGISLKSIDILGRGFVAKEFDKVGTKNRNLFS